MEELAGLFSPNNKAQQDLVERLVNLLDRQTDHRLSPNMMIGFMGMFNLLSIMSVLRGNGEYGIREVSALSESRETASGAPTASKTSDLQETLTGLMKSQSGNGQPDLMGLLGNLAAKKKINPNLLLTLMSMLSSQMAQANSSSNETVTKNESSAQNNEEGDEGEKKTPEPDEKFERRLAGSR